MIIISINDFQFVNLHYFAKRNRIMFLKAKKKTTFKYHDLFIYLQNPTIIHLIE